MLRGVCRAWFGDREPTLEPIAADGFSGATLLRAGTGDPSGDVVLKSLPAGAGSRIAAVHRLMTHLRAAGATEIPEVVATPAGDTLVADASGGLWEAVRFVPGVTCAAPAPVRARAAAAVLARLHGCAATWPEEPPRIGVPPAIVRRVEHARRMAAEPWDALGSRIPADDPLAAALAARLAAGAAVARRPGCVATLGRIAALRPAEAPLQAVLRDVWSDHVIFADGEPARVQGVVDLHAAGVDTPATDVARLFGSWLREPDMPLLEAHGDAIAAYTALRPLAPRERALVPWLDATATVFGLDNWFRWVLVEGRRFERPARVLERVDGLLAKLDAAFEWLDRPVDAV